MDGDIAYGELTFSFSSVLDGDHRNADMKKMFFDCLLTPKTVFQETLQRSPGFPGWQIKVWQAGVSGAECVQEQSQHTAGSLVLFLSHQSGSLIRT